MKSVNFEGVNRVYGKDQNEYNNLPAMVESSDPTGTALTCCELTDEEKKIVAETGVVYVDQLTFHNPLNPMRVFVTNNIQDEIQARKQG